MAKDLEINKTLAAGPIITLIKKFLSIHELFFMTCSILNSKFVGDVIHFYYTATNIQRLIQI